MPRLALVSEQNGLVSCKRCRVCDDKALGFNFNGLTCESCKAFFRRNAYELELLTCQRGGNCHMNKFTRKYCRKCRLDKCFEIGMKKELISRHQKDDDRPMRIYSTTLPESSSCLELIDIDNISLISNERTTDLKHYELTQLQLVHKAVSVFTEENSFQIHGEVNNFVQFLNFSAWNVRQVIKFCKSINAFSCLNEPDQLQMLKGFYPEKTAVRIAFMYDMEKDGFVAVENENDNYGFFVRMTVLNEWIRSDILSTFRNFVYCLHMEMENDEAIRDLILVHLLFKGRPKVTRPEYVKYHNFMYIYLLRRYLEHKYVSVDAAEHKFCSITYWLDQIDAVTGSMREVYSGMQSSPDQLTQVLAEIYNLI